MSKNQATANNNVSNGQAAKEDFKATVKRPPASRSATADDDEPLPTDHFEDGVNPKDIHAKLRAVRRVEVVALGKSTAKQHTIFTSASNFKILVLLETRRYLKFVWDTWMGLFLTTLFGGLNPFEWFTIFFFALGGTILLAIVLVGCLLVHSPALVRIYYLWADRYGGGLGLVNSGNPNLFHALTLDQAAAAKEVLSSDIKDSKDSETERFFNLDAAKLLLQLASVIYEHENDAIREAVKITSSITLNTVQPILSAATNDPTQAPTNLFASADSFFSQAPDPTSKTQIDDALAGKGDIQIRKFCERFGLDFEPVSELNNTASAFAGLFWDPLSNWIVVAFKGTAPIEFGEWLSDFNTKMTPCGNHIDGFKRVHKGFKDRVFPEDVSGLDSVPPPIYSISLGVKALAKHLRKTNKIPAEKSINVWMTGHSLGCATASLVYSRFLMRHKDMGKKSLLRDAYLFAAPIVCDRDTVDAFNTKMMEDKKRPKTMWRITSNGDAVATCLPELGDYTSISVSHNNAFAFAHLGTEIKMRDHPLSSHVTGNHVHFGARVSIASKFTKEEISAQRAAHLALPGEQKRESIGILLQKIPIIGRIVAHCTIYYWDQMDRMAIGMCEWVTN